MSDEKTEQEKVRDILYAVAEYEQSYLDFNELDDKIKGVLSV